MTNEKQRPRANTLNAEAWISAAGRAIAEGGVGAVAVEPLAQKLGVTKGSFYWHFPNRDALLQATLERWEEACTEAMIATVARIVDPRERLAQLMIEALTDAPRQNPADSTAKYLFGHEFDLAIGDAADHPIVRPVLTRVSERRLAYLAECFRALGLTAEAAWYQAILAFAVYTGTIRLIREAPGHLPQGEAFRAYLDHVIATILPKLGPIPAPDLEPTPP